MGVPLFGYNVSGASARGIHSGLNSGVTGFCFDSKLRKCSEDPFFFGRHEGKLEIFTKICRVAASLETLREDPTVRFRDKQAVWKLLSEISRTSPACVAFLFYYAPINCKPHHPHLGIIQGNGKRFA